MACALLERAESLRGLTALPEGLFEPDRQLLPENDGATGVFLSCGVDGVRPTVGLQPRRFILTPGIGGCKRCYAARIMAATS